MGENEMITPMTEFLNQDQKLIYNMAQKLKDNGFMFQYMEDEPFNGRFFHIGDKEMLHFANCSYLGLENHPVLVNKSIEAIKKYGTQTSNSRAALSSPLYKEVEDGFKKIFPGYHVITKTVTLGHLSVLPLLIQGNDAIILDAFAHNSIRMAAQWCKANGTEVFLSRHNDMENIKYLCGRLKKNGIRNIWYCADSIYSMHGDFMDIKGLEKIINEEDSLYAYIDDAHGTGWYGEKGCGYVFQNIELHPKIVAMESFAKSYASCGGMVVVSDPKLARMIQMTGQTMLFSGPLQPSVLGAILGSIEVHLSSDFNAMQKELEDMIDLFRIKSNELGLPVVTKDISPIQLIKIGDIDKTYSILKKILDAGFFTTSAVYPAVSMEDSGIRVSMTRHLTMEDVNNLLLCISKAINENG